MSSKQHCTPFSIRSVERGVINSKWIGTAVSLALCTAALTACSNSGNSSNQPVANASAPNGSPKVQWNSKLASQLREIIANAPQNGLKPSLFLKGNEQGAQLTNAALRYADALAHGFVDPTKISQVYTVPRPSDDIKQGFLDAVQKNDLVSWFNSLPPQTDEYKALSLAHIKYLKLAAQTKFQPVADGKPINPNSRDDRVPQLEAALSAMGYLGQSPKVAGQPPSGTSAASTNTVAPAKALASGNASGSAGGNASNRYRPALVKAVKELQSDFGLKVDGIVGGNTLAAINLGPAGLSRTCAIAMERLRWLQRNPPATRIDVNTAATILDYWRDGQHLDRRNVVAGEPDKQTPQIEAPITTLVAYPKWRVPDSISSDELSKKSPDWLKQNQFSIENGKYVQESGPKIRLESSSSTWTTSRQSTCTTRPQKPSLRFLTGIEATAA